MFLILSFILGILLTYLNVPRLENIPDWLIEAKTRQKIEVIGEIQAVNSNFDNRLTILINNVYPINKTDAKRLELLNLSVDLKNLKQDYLEPLKGQKIIAKLEISKYRDFKNINGISISNYYANQNIWYRAWTNKFEDLQIYGEPEYFAKLRAELKQSFIKQLFELSNDKEELPQYLAVLPALLFNEKKYLNLNTINLITKAGLRHSFALSGQHLSVISIFAVIFIYFVQFCKPTIWQYIPRSTLLVIFALPLALCYLWLGSAPTTLIRAVVMLFILALFRPRNHYLNLLDILFIAILFFILADPNNVFNVSLQLSCVAMIGVATSLAYLKSYYSGKNYNKHLRNFIYLVSICIVAVIILLPLLLYYFSGFNPNILLSIIWVPALGCIVLPVAFFALALNIIGINNSYLLELASYPCKLLLDFLTYLDLNHFLGFLMSFKPHVLEIIAYYFCFLALVICIMYRKHYEKLIVFALSLALCTVIIRYYNKFNDKIVLSLFDVGQAQAVHLKYSGGQVLIDAGGFFSKRFDSGKDIIHNIIAQNSSLELDYIFVSHMDTDHAGGVPFFLTNYKVGNLALAEVDNHKPDIDRYRNLANLAQLSKINEIKLAAGDRIMLGNDLYFEVLYPKKLQKITKNTCLALRLVYKNQGLAILLGDNEKTAQKEILELATQNKQELSAELLVLPHHGSNDSYLPQLYSAVNPKIALVSAGFYTRWQMPGKAIKDDLKKRNIDLYNTAIDGEIRVIFKPINNTIQTKVETYEHTKKRAIN